MEDIWIGSLAVISVSSYLLWLLLRNPLKRLWSRHKGKLEDNPAALENSVSLTSAQSRAVAKTRVKSPLMKSAAR